MSFRTHDSQKMRNNLPDYWLWQRCSDLSARKAIVAWDAEERILWGSSWSLPAAPSEIPPPSCSHSATEKNSRNSSSSSYYPIILLHIYIIFIENRKLYLRWSRKAQRTKERTKEGRKEGRKKRIRLISRLSRATIVYGQAWLPDVTFLERMRACYALCRYTYTHCMYVRSLNISSIVSAILCQISARNGIFTEEISYLNFETIIVETKPRLNVRPCFFFFSIEKNTRSFDLIYGEHTFTRFVYPLANAKLFPHW